MVWSGPGPLDLFNSWVLQCAVKVTTAVLNPQVKKIIYLPSTLINTFFLTKRNDIYILFCYLLLFPQQYVMNYVPS